MYKANAPAISHVSGTVTYTHSHEITAASQDDDGLATFEVTTTTVARATNRGVMGNKITAWAWRHGLIEFGEETPEGALPIIHGEETSVRELVEVLARHGKGESKGQLLVPGVPEAADADEALDALIAFSKRAREQMA